MDLHTVTRVDTIPAHNTVQENKNMTRKKKPPAKGTPIKLVDPAKGEAARDALAEKEADQIGDEVNEAPLDPLVEAQQRAGACYQEVMQVCAKWRCRPHATLSSDLVGQQRDKQMTTATFGIVPEPLA